MRSLSLLIPMVALLGSIPAVGPAHAQSTPWVITTDYSLFGRVRSFAPQDPWTVSSDLATIPGDAVGRWHEGLVYIVGRGGANLVQVYDPGTGFSLVREFSLGDGLNPQDIAFAPDGSAYVSCYDSPVLLRIDPGTGEILDTFDTSAYADADGLPETGWMFLHEGLLYLTCQRLDRNNWYAPTGPGLLLVFNLADRTWSPPVALAGADPYTRIRTMTDAGGRTLLAVGCVGYYALLDGGIELVDPAAGQSEGYLLTEQELGGDVINFVFSGPQSLHVLLSSSSFATSIVHVDLGGGGTTLVDASSGYTHADLAWDGDFQLYVADRTVGAAGIRVFDSLSDAELTDEPLATGLPPFLFILPGSDGLSPSSLAPAAGLVLGSPFPNPCNPVAQVPVHGPADTDLQVSVFDVRGHRVSRSVLRTDGDGEAVYTFTGRDDRGAVLAAGLYRVAVGNGRAFAARTVVLVK